jgi:hypothetical protein
MPNIFSNHPKKHKRLAKTYFIKNTIKFHPEYTHLAKTYAPFFTTTHPMHIDYTIRYPHLHHYIQNISPPSPPSHIIYALINTLHPLINKCNNNIFTRSQNEEIDWTINLLNTLKSLHNSPETHINTTHPHTQFLEQNQKLTHPKKNNS